MKLQITSLLVAALSLSPMISSSQEKAPAAPVKEKAWVPSTPLEKKARDVANTIKKLPGIIGSIKDQATIDAAKKSMTALNKDVDAHVAEIKKLPVPDNATRSALSDRMDKEMATLGPQMQQAMMGMATLPPELAPQIQTMMAEFGKNMDKHEADMNKYFEPDDGSGDKPEKEETKKKAK